MGGLATVAAIKFGASKALASKIGAGVTTGLIASGTTLDVVGTLRAGEAAKDQSEIEEELANAQALQEEIRGTEEERLRRKAGEKLESRQRAQFAKGGVRVGEGTPLLLMAETVLDTTEDIAAIREGTSAKASAFRFRGQTFRSIGKSKRSASRFKAGSSLLSGASDISRSNP